MRVTTVGRRRILGACHPGDVVRPLRSANYYVVTDETAGDGRLLVVSVTAGVVIRYAADTVVEVVAARLEVS